jgi:hypothetical protein
MKLNFFRKKIKTNLADFCNDYYDHKIFPTKKESTDLAIAHWGQLKKSVEAADQKFVDVPFQKFVDEMTIIWFEVFALAWMHKFGYELAIENSIFTKDYLIRKNHQEIWDNSDIYNKVFSRNCNCKRCTINKIAQRKVELSLYKKGYDPKCIIRTANRYSTETEWKEGITVELIAFELAFRLDGKIKVPAVFKLVSIIKGLYVEILRDLQNIEITSQ